MYSRPPTLIANSIWGWPLRGLSQIGRRPQGIEVRHGENILIADSPQDFAQAVVRVIRDKELAWQLAENGRRWVEQRYNWRMVYGRLDAVYEGLVGRARRRSH